MESLLIQTTDFGQLEITEESILFFPKGLFGFEQINQYVLLHYDLKGDSPIMCLQSIGGEVSFTVVDPFYFVPEYTPTLSAEELKMLQVQDRSQLRFLAVAVIGDSLEKTVMNLKSPVVLNPANHLGMQIILTEGDYAQRHPLFSSEDVSKHVGG